jgi:hypothetical protein
LIDIETIFFNQLLFKYKIVYKAIVRHTSETIDPHCDSNILTAFAYGLYFLFISQLVRNLYSDLFWGGHHILNAVLFIQG